MLLIILGCAATIRADSNIAGAQVYLTDRRPNPESPPAKFVARGATPYEYRTRYTIFDEWWLWVEAPGAPPQVQEVPGEVRFGPLAACVTGLVLVIPLVGCLWVESPTDRPVYFSFADEPPGAG